MNTSKLNSLLTWVNLTGVGPCIESLEQLNDGVHFIELIRRANGDGNGTAYCDTPVQRYRHISSFLNDFYHSNTNIGFTYNDTMNRCQSGDIPKLTALLMCACCMGNNNEHFVKGVEKLDHVVQNNIMEIIQHIALKGSDTAEDILLADNYVDILYKSVTLQADCTRPGPFLIDGELIWRGSQSEADRSYTPVFSSVSSTSSIVRTPGTPARVMTPLRAFISSPQMKQKIMARKRHFDIRKLESQLATEKALRLDMEAEITENKAMIKDQSAKLDQLRHEVAKRRKLQGQLESMHDMQDDLDKELETNRDLKKRLSDLDVYKKENGRLQSVIDRMMEEMGQLRSEMKDYQYLKSTNRNMESTLRHNEAIYAEHNVQFQQVKEVLAASENKNAAMKARYEEQEAIYISKVKVLQERLAQQCAYEQCVPTGESLAVVSEMKMFELEEKIKRLQRDLESVSAEKQQVTQAACQMQDKLSTENKMLTNTLAQKETEIQQIKQNLEILSQNMTQELKAKDVMVVSLQEKVLNANALRKQLEGQVEMKIVETKKIKAEMLENRQRKAEEVEKFVVDHQELTKRLEIEINCLKDKLITQMRDNETMKADMQQLAETKKKEINKLMTEHKDVVQNMEQEGKNLKEEIIQQLTVKEKINQEYQVLLETKTEEFSKIMTDHKHVTLEMEAEKQILEEKLNNKIQKNAQMTEHQQETIRKFEMEKNSFVQQLHEKDAEISDWGVKLEQMELVRKNNEEQLEARTDQFENMRSVISATEESKTEEIQKLIIDHQKITQKMKSEGDYLREELAKQTAEYEKIQGEIQRLDKRTMEETKQLVSDHQEVLERMERNEKCLTEELTKQVKETRQVKEEVQKHEETKLNEINKLIAGHHNVVESVENRLKEELKKQLAENGKMKTEFQRLEETKTADISKLKLCHHDAMENLEQEVRSHKVELKKQHAEIENMKVEFQQLEEIKAADISKLKLDHNDAIENMERDVSSFKEELNNQLVENKNMKVDFQRLEATKTENINKLKTGHQLVIESMEREQMHLKEKLKKQVSEMEILKIDKNRLHEELTTQKQTIEQMAENNSEITQRCESEKSTVMQNYKQQDALNTELQEKVNQMEVDKISRENQLQNMKVRVVQQMEMKVDQLEKTISVTKETNAIELKTLMAHHKEFTEQVEREKLSLKEELEKQVIESEKLPEVIKQIEEKHAAEIKQLMTGYQGVEKRMQLEKEQLKVEFQKHVAKLDQMTAGQQSEIQEHETHKSIMLHEKDAELAQKGSMLHEKDAELAQIHEETNILKEEKLILENQIETTEREMKTLNGKMNELTERLSMQSTQYEEELRKANEMIKQKIREVQNYQQKCESVEEEKQHLTQQLEKNASEIEKVQIGADEWIKEKNEEISMCAFNTQKMMATVKDRDHVIENLVLDVEEKDQEILSLKANQEKIIQEKDALDRQLNEHTLVFEEEMKAIKHQLTTLTQRDQNEQHSLEVKVQKYSKSNAALEAKLQRVTNRAKDDHGKMEKQLEMVTGMKDQAMAKAEVMCNENIQLKVEIKSLQTKLDQTEEELCEMKKAHFGNFSGVEFMNSMDSIPNDSLDGDLSPDDLDASKASNSSTKSVSGFSLGKLSVTVSWSDKKKFRRNVVPAPAAQGSLLGSQTSIPDSMSSFQQPSFQQPSFSSARKSSLRSAKRSERRESILPFSVDNTIDELAQSQPSFLRSSARQQSIRSSRQTTGRSGFVVVHDCDDEPDLDIDWNRLSELQRRNTLCLPHQQTSYPVEVQMQAPSDVSEEELQKGMTAMSVTRGQKRRSVEQIGPLANKLRTGNERQAMPQPQVPLPHNTTCTMPPPSSYIHLPKRKMPQPEIFFPSSNFAPLPPTSSDHDQVDNRRESVAFSVGFSPKQPKRRPRKPLQTKNLSDKGKDAKARTRPPRTPKKRGTPVKGTPKKETPKKKKDKTPGKRRKSFFFGK